VQKNCLKNNYFSYTLHEVNNIVYTWKLDDMIWYTHSVIWYKTSSYNAFVILITERNVAIELYIYSVDHYEIIFLIKIFFLYRFSWIILLKEDII
jgi:hypothetical protein